jgi:hypothetical protein
MGKLYSKKIGESKKNASKKATNISKRLKYTYIMLTTSVLFNIYFMYFLTTKK